MADSLVIKALSRLASKRNPVLKGCYSVTKSEQPNVLVSRLASEMAGRVDGVEGLVDLKNLRTYGEFSRSNDRRPTIYFCNSFAIPTIYTDGRLGKGFSTFFDSVYVGSDILGMVSGLEHGQLSFDLLGCRFLFKHHGLYIITGPNTNIKPNNGMYDMLFNEIYPTSERVVNYNNERRRYDTGRYLRSYESEAIDYDGYRIYNTIDLS